MATEDVIGLPKEPVKPVHINFFDYIEENKPLLAPPVCNKMIHNDGILRVMIVGGPNQRKDYHMNLGEELFYQIKGDMCLKVMEAGEPKDVVIKEGEIFCLPGKIPHSPQRFENTIGLVIERVRLESELDGLRYFVDDSNKAVLWQRYFYTYNLGKQLKPLIEEYFASEEFKSRTPAADMPTAPWEADSTILLPPPFPLASRFPELKEGAQPLRLFHKPTKEFVVELVGGETRVPAMPVETEVWCWLLEGGKAVAVAGDAPPFEMKVNDTVLLPRLDDLRLEGANAKLLLVYSLAV